MSLPALIEVMKTTPTAFLGRTGQPYAGLVGFIMGYVFGVRSTVGDMSLEVFPREFNQFVKRTLGEGNPASKFDDDDHWSDIILKTAGSDEAAFKLFHELWERFNQSKTS